MYESAARIGLMAPEVEDIPLDTIRFTPGTWVNEWSASETFEVGYLGKKERVTIECEISQTDNIN